MPWGWRQKRNTCGHFCHKYWLLSVEPKKMGEIWREPRSHLLDRASASSSVTCPPNTTLLIPSEGCQKWNLNPKSPNHLEKKKKRKEKSTQNCIISPAEMRYLVRADGGTRSGGGRIGWRRFRPSEQICGGGVWLPHRSGFLHSFACNLTKQMSLQSLKKKSKPGLQNFPFLSPSSLLLSLSSRTKAKRRRCPSLQLSNYL